MAIRTPGLQVRSQYHAYWGQYATTTALPNGSGAPLPAADFDLEAGDTAYVTGAPAGLYECISAGTPGGGDAVWAGVGIGPWSSVLYVDGVRGNDTTGQRGNMSLPFLTPQAALNAMQTGDVVTLAPQTFVLNAPLTVPAAVSYGSCYGYLGATFGRANSFSDGMRTVLVANGIAEQWNLSATGAGVGLSAFTIGAMLLGPTNNHFVFATTQNVLCDGTLYGAPTSTFMNNGLCLDRIQINDAPSLSVVFKYVRTATIQDCNFASGAISLTGGATTIMRTFARALPCTIIGDTTDPLSPTNFPQLSILIASIVGGSGASATVTFTGQSALVVDDTSSVGGLRSQNLAVNGAFVPSMSCTGNIGGAGASGGFQAGIDFKTSGLPDTATVLTFDLRGSKWMDLGGAGIGGVPAIRAIVTGAAPANFQTIKCDDTTALPGILILADSKIHITGRGAIWPQMVLQTPGTTTADGDIIPPAISGTIDLHAGGTVAQTWVGLGYAGFVRAGAAPDVVLLTSSAQGADAVVKSPATTGFTTVSTAVAGNTAANWEAIWK